MVIGLNKRTAPLAMRERFWISENRRYEVLRQLTRAEGVEEVVVLSTCCRTEFLLWASEPTLAANSLLKFLGSEHGLKLSEWQHFYRLLDECGPDSHFPRDFGTGFSRPRRAPDRAASPSRMGAGAHGGRQRGAF